MKKITMLLLTVLMVGIFLMGNSRVNNMVGEKKSKYVIAYIFAEDKLIDPKSVAVEKLTHINYAFADIKDGKILKGFKYDKENFEILNNLKKRNPNLKILISIGGWTWSGNFSDMALTKKSRFKFIKSAVDFAKKYNLDGIDIDWEFPGLIGYGNKHRPGDKKNFTLLLKEMEEELTKEYQSLGKKYLLTIAVGGFKDFILHTEMSEVQKHVDFINLMTYDLYESEVDKITGHHSPLFTNPQDPKKISADQAVCDYIEAGVPTEKIVLGVPFYGRAWGQVDSKNMGLYQPGKPVRISTSFKKVYGTYYKDKNFIQKWDEISQTSYLYNKSKNIFISNNDERTMKAKAKYILKKKLRGVMFWEYSEDYKNKLLDALISVLSSEGQ